MTDLPVAHEWFMKQHVDDGVTLITEPHVNPLLRCNVWLVEGRDRDLVVDTAMGIRPLRALVERQIGHDVLAVATHTHGDHVGSLHEFDHRLVHPIEAETVAVAGLSTLEVQHYPDSVLDPYRNAGYEFGELFIDAVPEGGIGATVYEIAPAPATQLIEDGDVIDLGDRTFEVMHLPGHSPGSIGLWEESSGTLFSGDAVYDGPLLDDLEGSNIDQYIATMERLREMPVNVVHGGHENSFGRDRLVAICDEHLARWSAA